MDKTPVEMTKRPPDRSEITNALKSLRAAEEQLILTKACDYGNDGYRRYVAEAAGSAIAALLFIGFEAEVREHA